MAYTPDITRYQQIRFGGITGPYDCTAWSAALLVDAHTNGGTLLSGRSIRLATDEAVPDSGSPGLNLPQVDAAVYRLTNGRVNLDTRVQSQALYRGDVRARIIDGRWGTVQVIRGVLVDRGYGGGNGFRGSHALTVHARDTDNAPLIGDPLVARYIPASWDAIFDAAEALTRPFAPGKVYAQFTRDLTPDYRVTLRPNTSGGTLAFFRYIVGTDGRITRRISRRTGGFSAACTPPKWHGGVYGLQLVQVTDTRSAYYGWWLDARYADEVIP